MDDSIRARKLTALGFAALLVFVLLGLSLETLHAFKAALYLDADQGTRRLLLRLGHAHGGVLSLLQIAYGLTSARYPDLPSPLLTAAFLLALVLVPSGFLLGAWGAHGADPGVLVLLVPAGAFALLLALGITAQRLYRSPPSI